MLGPWAVDGDADDVALIHFVQEGRVVVEMAGSAEAITLHAGDLAVFPHGSAHRLADRAGRRGSPLRALVPERPHGRTHEVRLGSSGDRTVFLCSGLGYDGRLASPLYRLLPEVFVLRREQVAATPLLDLSLRHVAEHELLHEPVGAMVALRAFETVVVLAIRAGWDADPGLLPVRAHDALTPAVHAVHTRYDEPWTVAGLAALSGMTRSVFAAAFRDAMGRPPLQYLTAKRVQVAVQLLVHTDLPVARVAHRVGYGSAAGLHAAVLAVTGRPPGAHRRQQVGADPSGPAQLAAMSQPEASAGPR